jgi:hypothetical protein
MPPVARGIAILRAGDSINQLIFLAKIRFWCGSTAPLRLA